MNRRRKRKWPKIDLYQKGGSGSMKMVSESALDHLMSKADVNKWNAVGRPDWFQQHRPQFLRAVLVIFGTEGSSLYRCIVTVILDDGTGGRFTLDVSVSDYDTLEDLDEQATVIMAHDYLATFPVIGLDDAQAQTWDQSVWKRWGES